MSTAVWFKLAHRAALALGVALMVWGLTLIIFKGESAQAWSLVGVGAATFGGVTVGGRKHS
jgi:threonine/homoserine efflux transporter RhtA